MAIIEIIEIKMCKSISIYRIFTINSTVCTNISTSIKILEKIFTTIIIALCSDLFQEFITCTQLKNKSKYLFDKVTLPEHIKVNI